MYMCLIKFKFLNLFLLGFLVTSLNNIHAQNLEPILINSSILTSEGASPVTNKKEHTGIELQSITTAERRTVEQTVADMLNGNLPNRGSGSERSSKSAN